MQCPICGSDAITIIGTAWDDDGLELGDTLKCSDCEHHWLHDLWAADDPDPGFWFPEGPQFK